MLARSRFLGLALLALGAGCDTETEVRVEYEPYAGEAYPNRVEPVAYPPGGAALVTDSYSDTISVIDLMTGARLDARPVGRNPVDIDGPHHVAIDAATGTAFVALSYPRLGAAGPHAQHGSSVIPGWVQKLRLSDLSVVGAVRVDPNPGDIVLSEDGSRLVVSHFDLQRAIENATDIEAARATLALVDPAQVLAAGSPPPPLVKTCVAPHGVALTKPAGATAYVACYGEDRLGIVHLDQPGTPVELVDVGPGVVGFGAPSYGPYVALLSPDDAWVVVSNTVSKNVKFFDTALETFDEARTIAVQGAPYFPAFTLDGKLAIPTQQPDALVIVDLDGVDATVVRTFTSAECTLPHEAVVTSAGTFVVCEGDKESPGKVIKLDAGLAIEASTEVGVYPDSFRLVPGGGS